MGVFVSYSWDSETHRKWVLGLSERLREDGIESILDQWHAIPGDNLPEFMETAIRENDFVIIICTPKYKQKADKRQGGVGYEGDIMTGEAFVMKNRRKFIPILREGEWKDSAPSWILGSYYLDFRGGNFDSNYAILKDTLHKRLPEPPPIIAQGFRILPDKSVLDSKTKLIWTNCGDVTLVDLKDLNSLLLLTNQQTGWEWRLPSDSEVQDIKAAEEYYAQPPIMAEVEKSHPFFGTYKKLCWTNTFISNVKDGDIAQSPGNTFNANQFYGGFSGYASSLNVNAGQVASEAETIRRSFPARFVRPATEEDLKVQTPDLIE
ncbi:hypothetical protein A4H97_33660 [Niastella yeongjuensis]|uniref:SEFIR domain-containing protein n=1 Tax=Niastella yeongjuensis TaxID=354355 RepID=A0A1V9EDI9_9BACT|nr:toll/interleukin-1 receptor domain-containing protein [Niastella yeongjuensis]OQP44152.1 hypothetical protein A4H97_33660 [Niastella yeongjuensis]SEO49964.1 SEFIR domain-containing protein [Niastella yeongjuensis]